MVYGIVLPTLDVIIFDCKATYNGTPSVYMLTPFRSSKLDTSLQRGVSIESIHVRSYCLNCGSRSNVVRNWSFFRSFQCQKSAFLQCYWMPPQVLNMFKYKIQEIIYFFANPMAHGLIIAHKKHRGDSSRWWQSHRTHIDLGWILHRHFTFDRFDRTFFTGILANFINWFYNSYELCKFKRIQNISGIHHCIHHQKN